ncbi:hypothetical protein [Bordetella hinzii]|uniref:N-acetyltransferase YedL n=1 Tax=Bordetella hinzii OH87 BAL007II TaxID=1331262 RepID=A0ABR4R5X8_9BORD|nr:hypothetical protein [Bordetella hinzii]KCB26082.1 hypothetical protein L544_3233 [Bordetella hinzii OH87 BAL007II]
MATTWKELVKGTALTGTAALMYTAPALTFATIQAAAVTNSTAGAVAVNVYIVPSGQSVGNAYRVLSQNVEAGATGNLSGLVNHKLEPGATIYADGNGLNLTISGAEYVPNT